MLAFANKNTCLVEQIEHMNDAYSSSEVCMSLLLCHAPL